MPGPVDAAVGEPEPEPDEPELAANGVSSDNGAELEDLLGDQGQKVETK